MKRIVFFGLFLIISALTMNAQTTETEKKGDAEQMTTSGPKMVIESLTVDYGTIQKGSDPLRKVTFTNEGTEPLVIKNARGSCGCTVPTWPREPIMPGESSVIEIRYDTKRVGPFTKTVKLTTNEKATSNHVIKIKGKVLAQKKEENLPTKAPNLLTPDK